MSNQNTKNRFLISNAIFCVSSATAECFIFPIDSVKTNMQIRNTSLSNTVKHMKSTGGLPRFYQGIQPAILRHWIYTNLRVGMYRPAIKFISNDKDKNNTTFFEKFLAGAFAGGTGQLIANPTDIVKVRMQANSHATYTNVIGGIYNTNGLRGFYKGSVPNVQRAILVNAGELAAYDTAKRYLLNNLGFQDNTLCFMSASIISGLCSTVLSCPADVVKSRLMNDTKGVYKGVLDCYTKTIRNEGFFAIYRGFIPTWMRLGPWHLIFWMTSENLRKIAGIETF